MQINQRVRSNTLILILAVFLLVFSAAYYSTLEVLFVQWSGVETAGYSHGFLVLLCTIYLLYLRKDAFRGLQPAPQMWALVPLACCSLLWFGAKVAEIQTVQMIAMTGACFFVVPAILGMQYLKLAFMPLFILLFALPIWQPTLPLLQDITTYVTHFNLRMIGRPVYVVGNFVHVTGGSFVIEEACSGLRFLLVAITLTLMNSTMNLHSTRQTLLLLAIAVGLAFVANWVRVLAVIMIGDYTQMQSSLVEDHANFGWILFTVFVLIPYFIINRYVPLPPLGADSDQQAERGKSGVKWNARGWSIVAASLLLLVAGPVLSKVLDVIAAQNERVVSLPAMVDGRTLVARSALDTGDWTPAYLGATATYFGVYGGSPSMELHVAYYASQNQGAELVNVNNLIADGSVWTAVPASEGIHALNGAAPIDVVQTLNVMNRRGQTKKVWYWYSVGGHNTSSQSMAKLLQMLMIFTGRADASLIAVAADCTETCADDSVFEQFASELNVEIQ